MKSSPNSWNLDYSYGKCNIIQGGLLMPSKDKGQIEIN